MSFRVAEKVAPGVHFEKQLSIIDVLSIQKVLQKSTGSAGLLMRLE
jgi:hypothetical protein